MIKCKYCSDGEEIRTLSMPVNHRIEHYQKPLYYSCGEKNGTLTTNVFTISTERRIEHIHKCINCSD